MEPEEEKLLSECEVQTYKASSKGGQHIQKTDSAVRLIHRPTGLRVTCQQERSQLLNKKICLEKLREKLENLAKKPKKRIPTKKSRSAKEKILSAKHKRSETKRSRSSTSED